MSHRLVLAGFVTSAAAGPKCCYSIFGDASSCGGYPVGTSAGLCNTDYAAPCSSDMDCHAEPTPVPSPSPRPTPAPTQGKCCWRAWGDLSKCGNYPAGASGALCGIDGVTPCQRDSDCTVPAPAPPSPAPLPTVTVELNNGVQMPVMAFAAEVWPAKVCSNATALALQAGFRFIWSSVMVGSDCQRAQGAVLAESGVPRSELFVAGTVAPGSICQDLDSCYTQTMSDANDQFDVLDVEELDMLMLEGVPSYFGCELIRGQWKAFEELYAAGRVRTIAVSNFDRGQLQCVVGTNGTTPSVNMLHYNVVDGAHDEKMAENTKLGVVVQAYSPLEGGALVTDELCARIGDAHGKSAAQVALKWILQTNATLATQSLSLSHLVDDMDIFDLILTDVEMSELNEHQVSHAAIA